ncbi:MAG: UvrD-helicase domain-containing protein [Planctomycetota bacterium]|jgi:exodeoxyribonuclease V beta subunit|nr:UvrD-helicase domain-containing protein [Planctomycetota bacterium]
MSTAAEFDVLAAPLTAGARVLIEANAGTGKTYNLQHLWLRLLLENELEPAAILVVTFTEAATAELRERIRDNLAAALRLIDGSPVQSLLLAIVNRAAQKTDREKVRRRLRLALAAFDEAAIFTIHGFCRRSLAFSGFADEILADDDDFRRETVVDFFRREALAGTMPPDVGIADLTRHAQIVGRHRDRLRVAPESCDENALRARLAEIIRQTPLPKRDSKFKRQLQTCQEKLAAGSLEAAALTHAEFCKDTAKNNAPELVAAAGELAEAPRVNVFARLRAFLADEKFGVAARQRDRQIMTFDDLLHRTRAALLDDQGELSAEAPLAQELRRLYHAALVDEFQDTDPTQYDIFHTVFAHSASRLYMLGDPKQAIYGFRGGDIYTYFRAAEDAGESRTLTKNFRTTAPLLDAVNNVFAPPLAFAEPRIAYPPAVGGREPSRQLHYRGQPLAQPLEIIRLPPAAEKTAPAGERTLVAAAAQILADFLGGDWQFVTADKTTRVAPGDLTVLVDKNRQARALQEKCRQRRIPAVIYRAGNVCKTADAQDLWHLLNAIAEPHRADLVQAALATRWGAPVPRPSTAATWDWGFGTADDLATAVEGFAALRRRWESAGIFAALTDFLEQEPFAALRRGAALADGERRITNFRHLIELLHRQEKDEPVALRRWLRRQITSAGDKNELYEQRLETDRNAVTIMTAHRSKGLEFPIVLCPFLLTRGVELPRQTDWTAHAPDNRLVLPLTKRERKRYELAKKQETLAENLRLTYVALTRAAHYCGLFAGSGKASADAVNYLEQIHGANPPAPAEFIAAPGVSSFAASPIVAATIKNSLLAEPENSARKTAPLTTGDWLAPAPVPAIDCSRGVLSYSALTAHYFTAREPAANDDEIYDESDELPAATALPRGKATGNFLHAILQKLDYATVTADWQPDAATREMFDALARRFGLDADDERYSAARRAQTVERIKTVLRRPLPVAESGNFCLADLRRADTLREWNFFFTVPEKLRLTKWREIGLRFAPEAERRRGLMTGSLDLFFRAGGRYYFADWKTDTLADYSPASLKTAMIERNYLLQAHLYAAAMDKHLRQTLGAAYDFPRHFGGGFYCFLRGITADAGVFAFSPTAEELRTNL